MRLRKMARKSKLTEKPARVPNLDEGRIEGVVRQYLAGVRPGESHTARAMRFVGLLRDLFEEDSPFSEELLRAVENKVPRRGTARIRFVRPDLFYGNVVVELETSLERDLEEAKDQLRNYVFCLSGLHPYASFLAVATDGVSFHVFSGTPLSPGKPPTTSDDVNLEETDRRDLSLLPAEEAFLFLDRLFFRKAPPQAPRTEPLLADFGLQSAAFKFSLSYLREAWADTRRETRELLLREWNGALRVAYGSPIGDEELFLTHTYLATLAKIMAWVRISDVRPPAPSDDVAKVLSGGFFEERGLKNFLEEDFFSWVARDEAARVGVRTGSRLLNQLGYYNLRELSEDVLKGLYQELVEPKERHQLGEFYTPDWLADKMVREMLHSNPRAWVLDPSCGSGTFLYMAIRFKRHELEDSAGTLKHIFESVAGIDVHPLAVTIAKTNYLLALGDLTKHLVPGAPALTIPVYLANSIKPPEPPAGGHVSATLFERPFPSYLFPIGGGDVRIPQAILARPTQYDSMIAVCRDFALQWKHRTPRLQNFAAYLHTWHPEVKDPLIVEGLFEIAERLRSLLEAHKDTIWAFILKNFAKPILLQKKFDVVIGNPPWLSYRYVESGKYQQFLKKDITEKYKLLLGRPELITHMELATLFFLSTADDYLKDPGAIGFVLPKSVFSGDQHHAFRSQSFQLPLRLTEAWDLEGVQPLFNVPACVFFAHKPALTQWPLPGKTFSGKLERKNSSLSEAERKLGVEETPFFLNVMGTRSALATLEQGPTARASPYKRLFKQGATIVPRAFWFVEQEPQSYDPNAPYLRSATDASERGKGQWKGVSFTGAIEVEFLYATLLSTDLVPFGHLPPRSVVLPIEPSATRYRMLTANGARVTGRFGLADWLGRAEREWETGRGQKAEQMSIYERLDHYRGITGQNPSPEYIVLYPDVNRLMLAAVVPPGQPGAPRFAAESGTYHLHTRHPAEAHYICAVLNSTILDDRLAPLRRRGQGGQPHVHKKVFDVASIPKFDPSSPLHVSLSSLAEQCSKRVSQFLLEKPPPPRTTSPQIGRLRSQIRSLLSSELAQIDELVKQILPT